MFYNYPKNYAGHPQNQWALYCFGASTINPRFASHPPCNTNTSPSFPPVLLNHCGPNNFQHYLSQPRCASFLIVVIIRYQIVDPSQKGWDKNYECRSGRCCGRGFDRLKGIGVWGQRDAPKDGIKYIKFLRRKFQDSTSSRLAALFRHSYLQK